MDIRFKFRAWHKPTKKLFHVHCFTNEHVFENTLDGVGTSPTNPANIEDCVLEQCTGLKDNKLRAVYEGDIVKGPSKLDIGQIEFIRGIFFVTCGKWVLPFNFFNPNNWEVIGNIHENPELLEAKNETKTNLA